MGIRHLKIIILTILLYISNLLFLNLQLRVFDRFGLAYCAMDGMAILNSSWIFGLVSVPLSWFLLFADEEKIYSSNYIIVHISRKNLWKKQVRRLFIRSVGFVCIEFITAAAACILSTPELWNWDSMYSLFFSKVNQICESSPAFIGVAFFLLMFWKMFFISLIFRILSWKEMGIWTMWIGYAIVLVIEWVFPKLSVFFNLFTVQYRFAAGTISILTETGAACILTVILYKAGEKVIEKKEFM